jgi:hypothetical protein
MPLGTLDVMKLERNSLGYQVMFEQNAGGTYVVRVDPEELINFMHEEMRIELPVAEDAARRAETDGRVRVEGISLDENDLHAVMEYLEDEE